MEKTRTNTHGKFKYAGHEDVNEALRGHFAELGIVRVAKMLSAQMVDGVILAECLISYVDIHDDTRIDVPMWAVQPSQTSKGGVTAQQIGQALSYATKNVEFKLFALTGDNEEDSDYSEAYNPREPTASKQKSPEQLRAEELLRMFELAQTKEEIDQADKLIREEWNDIKHVEHIRDAVVASRTGALRRVKESAQ